MRLSFYTYSYTDKLKMPVRDCLARIAKTGYAGIDVSGTNGPSDDPRSFDKDLRTLTRRTADDLKLKIEAVTTHAQLADSLGDPQKRPLDLNGSVDLAVELGAPVVTFHMGGYREGASRDEQWKRVVAAIRSAADYGAARHVRLAVDGIWPVWVDSSPDELARMFDAVDSPNFGVNLDPSYLTLMEVDPVAFTRRFPQRIFHAHLKDHKLEGYESQNGVKYPKWTHLMPGKGEMDYARVFKALDEIKFTGAAAVECFTDMKFEEACDGGYVDMVAAARKGGATFER
ncbi:MAG: sugar phosphate isomerase/epimerase family protein [Planctomycetaceae bacterium]